MLRYVPLAILVYLYLLTVVEERVGSGIMPEQCCTKFLQLPSCSLSTLILKIFHCTAWQKYEWMFESYLLLSLVCVFQLAAKRPNWELTTFVIIPINLEDMFEKGGLLEEDWQAKYKSV